MYKQPRELLETPKGTISSQAPQGCGEGSTTRVRSPDRTVKPHECAATKVCSRCKVEKPEAEFYAKHVACKSCIREAVRRHQARPEIAAKRNAKEMQRYRKKRKQIRKQQNLYAKKNAAAFAERNAKRYARLRERILEQKAEYAMRPDVMKRRKQYNKAFYERYYPTNKALYTAQANKRRAAKLRATPQWVDARLILPFYKEAERKTKLTGIRHVVDHIVPLQGKNVCGLHVPWNLQVITEAENCRKHNKHTG